MSTVDAQRSEELGSVGHGDEAIAAPGVGAPSWGQRLGRGLRAVWPPLLVFAIFIGIWSLLSVTVYGDENYLLPRPWDVLTAAVENSGELWAATKLTLESAAAGFGLAILIGTAGAVVMSQAKALERSFYPYAVMLQTVPVVAIAPVIVLWFGYGQKSVIVISLIIALFPILNNTLLGLLSTERNQLDLFRLHDAGRLAQFFKLRLPGAIPNIIAGLRVSAGLSVIGAIVGEFIIGSGGSEGGLGVKVIFAQSKLDTELLFAEVLAATALGFAFFLIVSFTGWLLLRNWHESVLRGET
jgi:NitT/TauT family transport system permease protein